MHIIRSVIREYSLDFRVAKPKAAPLAVGPHHIGASTPRARESRTADLVKRGTLPLSPTMADPAEFGSFRAFEVQQQQPLGPTEAHQQPQQQQERSKQDLVDVLTSALQQLSLASRSPSQSATATTTSAQVYKDSLKTVKYPTFDGTRNQAKVNEFLNVFSVLKTLNGLDDTDLVRLVVQHLRGTALLWWLEAAESPKHQQLLSSWENFKSAFRQRFVQWNASTADTQKLLFGLRQQKSARAYFTELREIRMRIHPIPNVLLFNIVYGNVKPHCRAALTRLQQLRSTEDLSLDEIEDVCVREDEAEYARFSAKKTSSFLSQQPSPAARTCPICGEPHVWKSCPQKKPDGCPACGGKCNRIYECPKSFAFKKSNSTKPKEKEHQHSKSNSRKTNINAAASSITSPFIEQLAPQQISISAQVIKTAALINSPKQLVFEGTLSKTPVSFLLDGGADHSILSQQFAMKNGIVIRPLDQPITTKFANGSSETIKFATDPLQLQCQGHRSQLQPLVSSSTSFDLLIGLDWLSKYNPRVDWDMGSLNISDENNIYIWKSTYSDAESHTDGLTIRLCTARQVRTSPTENENYTNYVVTIAQAAEQKPATSLPAAIQKLLQQFPDVQEEPSTLPPNRSHQHGIPLIDDAKPVRKSPYRLQPRELQHLRECIDKWLQKGWIRPSTSSWASPVFFVSKKNGELRLVVDYRGLNAQTQPDKFPLPLIDVVLDKMHGAKIFSRLDLRNGFYQIRMQPSDIFKTSFTTPLGLYEWVVMPMGLINAPASFQRVMTDIFNDLPFVQVYMDDIVVHSSSTQQHSSHLREVFQRLRNNELKLNFEKCTFHVSEIDFLGFHVSDKGILPMPANIKAISSMPNVLTSRTMVRRFLGMANYYAHFVPHFASIASPLHTLTSNTQPFRWHDECSKAVSTIKQLLSQAPVLSIFNPTLSTRITCDASLFGIGAVLEQQHEDGWHPVHYLSRTFSKSERNYPVLDKEWLSIIYAMTKWRHYLHKHFLIRTDHKPLVAILTNSNSDLQDRRARWLSQCLQFSYTVEHIQGKDNNVADVLSRLALSDFPQAIVASVESSSDSSTTPPSPSEPSPFPLALASTANHARAALKSDIIQYRSTDPSYMKIYERLSSPNPAENFTLKDDLIFYEGSRLLIPKHPTLRTRLIAEHHDTAYAGHLGRDRTTEFLSRGFYWPSLKQDVKDYVKTCDICMRSKVIKHPPQPPLSSTTAPTRWHTVSLDILGPFITNSPAAPQANTCILVFVDKLTKMLRLAACPQQLSAEQAARLFIEHVFRHHGLPHRLLSDQGPQFTSTFWKHIFAALRTKVVNTTPYYPQGNGQVERANRTILEGLRAFVNSRKDDWQQYLHLFEFAYNDTVHSATKTTPFFLNYGRHPTTVASLLNPELPQDLYNGDASKFLSDLHSAISTAHECINTANEKAAGSKTSQKPMTFQANDYVLLPSRCFRATRKLDAPYVGPFRIVRQESPYTFQLEGLPPGCSTVWNVRHFKPYYMTSEEHQVYRQQSPPPISEQAPDIFEVDQISDCWKKRDGLYYLVHWKGYPNPTWEPLKNLSGCKESISDFHKSIPYDEVLHSVPPRDRHRLKRPSSDKSLSSNKPTKRTRTSRLALCPLF